MGAPKGWLQGYLGGLVEKGEVFFLEQGDNIVGTCEVRKSTSAPAFADIGMAVSPDFRRQGYGTYMLNKAKAIAVEWGRHPICSCEKENVGSFKSISNCGFASKFQLLSITFN
jgi:predicted acetyltransferase